MKTVSRIWKINPSALVLGTGALCVLFGVLLFQLFDFSEVPGARPKSSGSPQNAQYFLQQAVRAISEVATRNVESNAWSPSFFHFQPAIPEMGDVAIFSNGNPQWRGLNSDFSGWSQNVSTDEASRWQRLPSDYSKRLALVSNRKKSFIFEKTNNPQARVLSISTTLDTPMGERVVFGHVDLAAFPLIDLRERQQLVHEFQARQVHWWSDPNVPVKVPNDSDLGLVALKDFDLWFRVAVEASTGVNWEKKIRAGVMLLLLAAGIFLGGRRQSKRRQKRVVLPASTEVVPVQWWVKNGNQTLGPFVASKIAEMLFSQEIDFDSMVRLATEAGEKQNEAGEKQNEVGEKQNEEPLAQSTVFSELPIQSDEGRSFWIFSPESAALKARIEGPFTAEALKQAGLRGWVPEDAWVCEHSTLAGWRPIATWVQEEGNEADSVPEVRAA